MKILIIAFIISFVPCLTHAAENIICAYNKHNAQYNLKAHLVSEDEWDYGLVIIDQDVFFRVYRLGQEDNIKKVIAASYALEDVDFETLPTEKQIAKAKDNILQAYKGTNFNDVEVEVPELFIIQQIPGEIVNNKYVDNHFEVTLRTIVVSVENRDGRKLEEYCPGKKVREGFLPPLRY